MHQNGFFQSRDEKIWRGPVLRHLREQLSELPEWITKRILDAELYKHGWKLQRINGAVATNRSEPRDDTHQIELHIFDSILDDFSTKFSRRWFDTYNTILDYNLTHIKVAPTALCHSHSDVDLHFHMYTSQGYEGIMLRPDGPYIPGQHLSPRTGTYTEKRSPYLWKHKAWQFENFLCVGATPGEGKASIGIGALVFERAWIDHNGNHHLCNFEVGTGYDDDERIAYSKNPQLVIGHYCHIKFLDYTEEGAPFNASFIGVLPHDSVLIEQNL